MDMLAASTGLDSNHSRRMFDFDYMEFSKFSNNFSARRNGTRVEEEYYDPSIMELKRVMDILNKYVLPIIIIIGIIGNMVSFLVYSLTPRLYRQSSNLYLAFLAIVDNLSLLCIFVVWFGWVEIHIFQENGWCQTVFYCTSVGSFLSAWTIVSFTCERWIVVFHPLKRHVLCTRKRALIVMTSLTVTSMILYSFSLFTTTVHHSNGSQVCGYSYFVPQQVVQCMDTMIIIVIPLVAIITMNTAIGIKICHYTKKNSKLDNPQVDSVDEVYSNCSTLQKYAMDVRGGRGGGGGGGGGPCGGMDGTAGERGGASPNQALRCGGTPGTVYPQLLPPAAASGTRSWRVLTRKQHTQVRITRALLIVSTVFVVLNLPSYAFRIHIFIISIRNEPSQKSSFQSFEFAIWQQFVQFLHYSNFSSRFFLYSLCSRNFRYALNRLACRRNREQG